MPRTLARTSDGIGPRGAPCRAAAGPDRSGMGQDRRVPDRPYVLLSAAMSVDGYIDDSGPEPLLLSDAADLDRVDAVRADVDAILVGATTLRRDDPRLQWCVPRNAGPRVWPRGGPPQPLKVTLTGSATSTPRRGSSPPGTGPSSSTPQPPGWQRRRTAVGAVADVVDAGDPLDLHRLLADLAGRGVRPADGRGRHRDAHAVPDRRHSSTSCSWSSRRSSSGDAAGAAVRRAGALPARRRAPDAPGRGPPDRRRGAAALPAGRDRCPRLCLQPSVPAVDRWSRRRPCRLKLDGRGHRAVAAVAAVGDGVLGGRAGRRRRTARCSREGWSRRRDPHDHAEEAATRRARPAAGAPPGTTLYSSLEPCSARASRPRTCTRADPGRRGRPGGVRLAGAVAVRRRAGRGAAARRRGGGRGAAASWPRRPARPTSTCSPAANRPRPARAGAVATLLRVLTRMSSLFLRTLREDPADAEVPSHKLLVRAGYVRRVAPGIYSWLPLGLRVLRAVEQIVREEMDAIGAQEIQFPALLPREPYEATGRWTEYGPNIFRLKDRRGGDYLLGPTHEELFTQRGEGRVRVLQGLPGDALPDPDQVPRRGAAARRDPARARVPDEGLLLVRPDRRGPGRVLPAAPRRLRPDLRPARPGVRDRRGHVGRDGRFGVGGVPGRRRDRRGHVRAQPRRVRGQRRGGHHARAAGPPLDGLPAAQAHHTPDTPTIETLVDFLNARRPRPHLHRRRHAEERAGQDAPAGNAGVDAARRSACPATARST